MSVTQLNPPIPLTTPRGDMIAHFLIDNGMEDYYYFFGAMQDSGEWWCYDNSQVRAWVNHTLRRPHISPFSPPGNCGTQK